MAQRIVDRLAIGGEVRWINLCGTEVDWKDDSLEAVSLAFEEHGYAGKATLAIMSLDEVCRAEREIREEGHLGHRDLGVWWRPKPQLEIREPGQPFYTQTVTLVLSTAPSPFETSMLRQFAVENPDGIAMKSPGRVSGFMDEMVRIGAMEDCDVDGKPAWRITDKGREAVA